MGTILVVTDNRNGFTFQATSKEIKKVDANVIVASFEDENISENIGEADLVFAVLSDNFDMHSVFFTSFIKKFHESDCKMAAYGSADRILDIKGVVQEDRLLDAFIRPIENTELVDKLSKMLSALVNAKEKKKILVVDDSGQMLRTIMGWLEADYEVLLANSASKAMAVMNIKRPDLILLDYEMPICSGPQFFQILHQDESTADIPVIFLTAQSDAESVKAVLALRPQGYILKTTPGAKVLEKIKDYFRSIEY